MQLIPLAQAVYAVDSIPLGVMDEPIHFVNDDFYKMAGVRAGDLDGMMYELTTGNLIFAPYQSPWPFGLATLPTRSTTGTGSKWKEVPWRPGDVVAIAQYDASPVNTGPGVPTYYAETDDDFLGANRGFAIHMKLGAAPPLDADKRNADYIFKHIIWPANAPSGSNMYRVKIAYGLSTVLQVSTDGGIAYRTIDRIPCPVDAGKLHLQDNVEMTLIVLPLPGEPDPAMPVWLGQDLNRATVAHTENPGYDAGSIRIEGKNGAATFAFSQVLMPETGSYTSYGLPAAKDLSRNPRYIIRGYFGPGQGKSGQIVERNSADHEVKYKLTVTGDGLSTPKIKGVALEWGPVFTPPSDGYEAPIENLLRIEEVLRFDPTSLLMTSWFGITVDNRDGRWRRNPGIQAVKIALGYRHAGLFPRGIYLGNDRGTFVADGGRSHFAFEADDLFYVLKDQPLLDDLNPTRWCCYAAARFLLQHGRLVPSLLSMIPPCPSGPDPGCDHPKMPARHGGWRATMPVLSCLAEVQTVIRAVMGQDPEGNFRFDPFDHEAPYEIAKRFDEAATLDGRNVDEILRHSGALRRYTSVDGVKNDFTFLGRDQKTGRLFAEHKQDSMSLYDRLAPNHTGFLRPYFLAWSGFVDRTFTREMLEKQYRWHRLPKEVVMIPCYGQPTLYPKQVVQAGERRTLGPVTDFGPDYFLTEVRSIWESSGRYYSNLYGRWTGQGTLPGWG